MSFPISHTSVRFGAKQIDDGHLSVLYRSGDETGIVPAQAWQLQARDYPRLVRLINWWGQHQGAEVFERQDLGSKVTGVPLLGGFAVKLKEINDALLGAVLPKKMANTSLIDDYALTVDGKTAAVVRMAGQNRASCRYYEKNYSNLQFDEQKPVYEIELLQAAFWNRNIKRQPKLLAGKLSGATEALLLHVAERLPENSELVFTPDNRVVDRLFKAMLHQYGITANVYYSRELLGRTDVRGSDYANDYPLLYRMKTSDFQHAAQSLQAKMAQQSPDDSATATVQRALEQVKEPTRLVRRAGFKALSKPEGF